MCPAKRPGTIGRDETASQSHPPLSGVDLRGHHAPRPQGGDPGSAAHVELGFHRLSGCRLCAGYPTTLHRQTWALPLAAGLGDAAPGWHPGTARRQFPSGGAGSRPDPGGTRSDDAAHHTRRDQGGRPLLEVRVLSDRRGGRRANGVGFADYPSRRAGFGPAIRASGDLSSDMNLIRAFYADKRGLHPERAGPVRLREEGSPANRAEQGRQPGNLSAPPPVRGSVLTRSVADPERSPRPISRFRCTAVATLERANTVQEQRFRCLHSPTSACPPIFSASSTGPGSPIPSRSKRPLSQMR